MNLPLQNYNNETQRHPSPGEFIPDPSREEGPGLRRLAVRPATEADLTQLLDIYNHVILNTTAVYSYDPHTLEMRQQWFAQKQQFWLTQSGAASVI